MNRKLFVSLCFTTISLALATAAIAAAPQSTDIQVPLHSLGLNPFVSDTCGFDVEVFNEARIRITEFADGTAQSHHHETFYWRANGQSLTEYDNFTIVFGQDETFAYHGAVFNIHVPGTGVAMVEAGNVIFDRNGNIIHEAGLHQVLNGTENLTALCDYLAGP